MKKILTFTDIHMRDQGETIIGLDPYVQLGNALAHALDRHGNADLVILMGDLTNSGKPSEYQRVATLLQNCPLPVILMPGNHDNRDTLLAQFPNTPTTKSGHLQTRQDYGDDCVLTLDTLDGPPFRNHHHGGILCAERLDWLETQLQDAQSQRVTVFTHHPIGPTGMDSVDAIGVVNAAQTRKLLKSYANVAHVFSGHVHRSMSGTIDDLSYTLFKSTCHQTPLILGVNNTYSAVTEPAGYGVVLLTDAAVIGHTEYFEHYSISGNL